METLLLLLVTGALNVACFFIGAEVGQMASKGERIELPKPDPVKAIREHQDRKQAQAGMDRYEAILRNVENYDGTGAHQEDVPRG
jgi:hypothetical protein